MSAHTVTDIIAAHRTALLEDVASYIFDGLAISEERAAHTGAAKLAAYTAFVRVQCQTADDVQAKLDYILNGLIGIRNTLLDCLIDYGDHLGGRFLRSLMVETPVGTLAEAA